MAKITFSRFPCQWGCFSEKGSAKVTLIIKSHEDDITSHVWKYNFLFVQFISVSDLLQRLFLYVTDDDDNELFSGISWPMKDLKPHFQPGPLLENLTIKKLLQRGYLKWIFYSMRITWRSRNYWWSWAEPGNVLFWTFGWEVYMIDI